MVFKFLLLLADEVVVIGEAVAALAIDAVEFHFHLEGVGGHEAFELRGAHVLDVHEFHVARDHEGDFFDGVIGIAEAAENFAGHVGSDFVVAVEAVALGGLVPGLGGRLADVMEEDGEGEVEGWLF